MSLVFDIYSLTQRERETHGWSIAYKYTFRLHVVDERVFQFISHNQLEPKQDVNNKYRSVDKKKLHAENSFIFDLLAE